MAKPGLQRPGVVAFVGQCVTTGMPQHVRMRLEAQLGSFSGTLDHAGKAGGAEGCAALRCEDERGLRFLFSLQSSLLVRTPPPPV